MTRRLAVAVALALLALSACTYSGYGGPPETRPMQYHGYGNGSVS
jgi:hypothetical protein